MFDLDALSQWDKDLSTLSSGPDAPCAPRPAPVRESVVPVCPHLAARATRPPMQEGATDAR